MLQGENTEENSQGFYHPGRGYWQTLIEPSQEILDSYPVGTMPYPVKPGEHYEPKDGGWVYVEPSAAPTPDMLTEEVNRRLSLGFDYDLGDGRGVHHFGTTDVDMKRWMQEVTPLAQAAVNMGEPNRHIGIKTDTGPTFVTASEWWRVLDAAADWRQPLYAAYFTLKALPEIPADYATNPAYWP